MDRGGRHCGHSDDFDGLEPAMRKRFPDLCLKDREGFCRPETFGLSATAKTSAREDSILPPLLSSSVFFTLRPLLYFRVSFIYINLECLTVLLNNVRGSWRHSERSKNIRMVYLISNLPRLPARLFLHFAYINFSIVII